MFLVNGAIIDSTKESQPTATAKPASTTSSASNSTVTSKGSNDQCGIREVLGNNTSTSSTDNVSFSTVYIVDYTCGNVTASEMDSVVKKAQFTRINYLDGTIVYSQYRNTKTSDTIKSLRVGQNITIDNNAYRVDYVYPKDKAQNMKSTDDLGTTGTFLKTDKDVIIRIVPVS
jgi:hypothetical protein